MLLAVAVLAAAPIPTQVFTATRSRAPNWDPVSIVVSASAPSGSQLFEDEKEVLASITSTNYKAWLDSIGMTTVSSTN